jgi:hypothetical protein
MERALVLDNVSAVHISLVHDYQHIMFAREATPNCALTLKSMFPHSYGGPAATICASRDFE